jgi:hypothetical protein
LEKKVEKNVGKRKFHIFFIFLFFLFFSFTVPNMLYRHFFKGFFSLFCS